MMRNTTCSVLPVLSALMLLSAPVLGAMDFDSESSSSDCGARIGIGIEKKTLSKRLTASLGEEVRFYDNFSNFTRSYTSAGLEYKLNNWVRAGAAYHLITIAPDSSDPYWSVRHRFQGSLTGSYRWGMFKASLKETVQMTHRSDDVNLFQQPRNAWALRSRIKASYEVLGTPLTPFLSVELRNALNAVDYSSLAGNTKTSQTNSVIYSDVYLNRIRIQAGTEYYIDKRNSIDLYMLCDLSSDRKVDATRRGVPKSCDLERSTVVSVGINYLFSWK